MCISGEGTAASRQDQGIHGPTHSRNPEDSTVTSDNHEPKASEMNGDTMDMSQSETLADMEAHLLGQRVQTKGEKRA